MQVSPWINNSFRAMQGIRHWSELSFRAGGAAAEIRELLGTRGKRFLELMRLGVYGVPASPYLALFRRVACEYGDLRTMVEGIGLEATLHRLADAGVYVTHDEMKGREPARRGSDVFHFEPEQFQNPLSQPNFRQKTSGSTGRATRIGTSSGHYQEQLPHAALSMVFHGLEQAEAALWIFPCEWSFSRGMRLSKILGRVARWYTPLPFLSLCNPSRQRFAHAAFIVLLNLKGQKLPFPRHASLLEPTPLLDWLVTTRRSGRRVLLVSFPSTAVRTCVLASSRRISLEGTVWLVAGEPVTPGKRTIIESTGARCLPLFGCTETGESAEGCLSPVASDDMHLYEHKFALISRRHRLGQGQDVDTPLFTSLSLQTPVIFLNGDTGDAGVVEERECGCPWGRLGFRTHLRDVWSYAKFTAEGMTLPGNVVMEVLERVMPRLFGGRSGDYQLVAETGENGLTRYLLLVSPDVGGVEEDAVRAGFRDALGRATHQDITDFLHQAGQFKVVRGAPVVQPSGKSLPFIVQKQCLPVMDAARQA